MPGNCEDCILCPVKVTVCWKIRKDRFELFWRSDDVSLRTTSVSKVISTWIRISGTTPANSGWMIVMPHCTTYLSPVVVVPTPCQHRTQHCAKVMRQTETLQIWQCKSLPSNATFGSAKPSHLCWSDRRQWSRDLGRLLAPLFHSAFPNGTIQ